MYTIIIQYLFILYTYYTMENTISPSRATQVAPEKENPKAKALAKFLDVELEEAEKLIEDGDYDVLTDYEAEDRRDEELQNYFDDCIQPELDRLGSNLSNYFDYEARKRDAQFDGRGHAIASYDGNEELETIDGTTYYIYRQN
jgi:antirestriction protein